MHERYQVGMPMPNPMSPGADPAGPGRISVEPGCSGTYPSAAFRRICLWALRRRALIRMNPRASSWS